VWDVRRYGGKAKLVLKRFERDLVKGWLHEPSQPSGDGLGITHGAGSNCEAPLIKAVAEAFAQAGYWVLRFDLPYRQERAGGAPHPSKAARDREGILRVAEALREFAKSRIFLGGSSYGGRQTTMLAAEKDAIADALLLLSYPLHPPGKLEQLRTAHFPTLRAPAMFVHGTRDSFGSIEEMEKALKAIPARTELVTVQGGPHGLPAKISEWLPLRFSNFVNAETRR
jgi:predicted alpha/beta-hydrolase family hydrolase